MSRPAFSRDTREAMVGWRLGAAYQLPQADGRPLKRCPQPSDPWCVVLHNGQTLLDATRQLRGIGDTLDEAAMDALSTAGSTKASLREALSRLGHEIDLLAAAYRG